MTSNAKLVRLFSVLVVVGLTSHLTSRGEGRVGVAAAAADSGSASSLARLQQQSPSVANSAQRANVAHRLLDLLRITANSNFPTTTASRGSSNYRPPPPPPLEMHDHMTSTTDDDDDLSLPTDLFLDDVISTSGGGGKSTSYRPLWHDDDEDSGTLSTSGGQRSRRSFGHWYGAAGGGGDNGRIIKARSAVDKDVLRNRFIPWGGKRAVFQPWGGKRLASASIATGRGGEISYPRVEAANAESSNELRQLMMLAPPQHQQSSSLAADPDVKRNFHPWGGK